MPDAMKMRIRASCYRVTLQLHNVAAVGTKASRHIAGINYHLAVGDDPGPIETGMVGHNDHTIGSFEPLRRQIAGLHYSAVFQPNRWYKRIMIGNVSPFFL